MTGLNGSFADLIKDIAHLLTTGYNHDVIVRCGRAPGEIADFEAHSAILGVRSPCFRMDFSLNYATRKNGVFLIRKENIEPNIFEVLMKYLYTSIINLDALSLPELIKLLVACDELVLSSVIDQIQSYIIDHHSKLLRQDPLNYLIKLNHCSRCSALKTHTINQFDQTFTPLFSSPHFISLNKEILKELLQKQYEGVGGVEVWDKLLEWSVNQANSSSFDPSLLSSLSPDAYSLYYLRYDSKKRRKLTLSEFESWNEQDCELVKHHISGMIGFIRWQEISLKDFDTHISPYQKLLPSSFYAELLAGYTTSPDPESHSPSDSVSQSSDSHLPIINPSSNFLTRQYFNTTLLTAPHFNVISAWIARKDSDYYTKRPLPYKFNLLYRASKDGFDPKVFHERCDNRGPTVMVSKLYLGGKIIGGYNPLDWKPKEQQQVVEGEVGSETPIVEIAATTASFVTASKGYSWMTTDDSFLFSFQHLSPTTGIISRVVKSLNKKAVCYDPKSGPGFGAGLDMVISNRYRTISTWGHSVYPEAQWFLTDRHMEVEDYEVFSVERDEDVELCDKKEEEEDYGFFSVEVERNEGVGFCGYEMFTVKKEEDNEMFTVKKDKNGELCDEKEKGEDNEIFTVKKDENVELCDEKEEEDDDEMFSVKKDQNVELCDEKEEKDNKEKEIKHEEQEKQDENENKGGEHVVDEEDGRNDVNDDDMEKEVGGWEWRGKGENKEDEDEGGVTLV